MPSDDLTLKMRATGARSASRDVDRTAKSVLGFGRAADNAGKSSHRATGSVRLMSSGLRASVGVFSGAAAALGVLGLAGAAREAITEFQESRRVGRQTNAVIKSTGGIANVTSGHVNDLANRLSAIAGIDDEVIQGGENMLLTFKNIRNETGRGNDIFDQASKTLIDLTAAMGNNPRRAAIQLGKALNDPVKGMTALTRVGVTFDAGQQKTIKHLVATGRTMDAQKLILRELNSEFGGSARAQADPLAKLQVAWGNLLEMLGGLAFPLITKGANILSTFVLGIQNGTGAGGRFAAQVKVIANDVKNFAVFLYRNRDALLVLTAAILGGAAALRAFMIVQQIIRLVRLARGLYLGWRAGVLGLTAAQMGLNVALTANPIGIVVVAVAALAAGLFVLYHRSQKARDIINAVWGALKAAPGNVWAAITTGLDAALNFVIDKINGLIKGINHLPGVDIGLIAHVGGGGDPANYSGYRGLPAVVGHAAQGGTVTRGGVTEVGERGRERVWLPQGARVEPNSTIMDGGVTEVHSHLYLDGKEVATSVERHARRRKATR